MLINRTHLPTQGSRITCQLIKPIVLHFPPALTIIPITVKRLYGTFPYQHPPPTNRPWRSGKMNETKQYLPIGLLLVAALIVTGIAGYQYQDNPSLGEKDSLWGIYLWLTPLAYLLIVWYLRKTSSLNRWPIALAGLLVYALSAFLLFVPSMPPGLQWHYPIGAAGILFYLFGDH